MQNDTRRSRSSPVQHPPSDSLVQWRLQQQLDAGIAASRPGDTVVHTGSSAMVVQPHSVATKGTGGDSAFIIIVTVLVWTWGIRKLWRVWRMSRRYGRRVNELRYKRMRQSQDGHGHHG